MEGMSKNPMTADRVTRYANAVGPKDAALAFYVSVDTVARWMSGVSSVPSTKLPLIERVVGAWERRSGKTVRSS